MDATKTARHLRDVAAEEASSIASMAASAGEAVGNGIGHATESVRHAADTVRHAAVDVGHRTVKGIHDVEDAIAHRPLMGAAIAAGVGFLLAAVILRRR
jgi:ElaB/YqjD/DUF883 family membrane-anchored ribosome-binding protein